MSTVLFITLWNLIIVSKVIKCWKSNVNVCDYMHFMYGIPFLFASSWCSTTDHFLNLEWNRLNLFLLANEQSKNAFKENACKVKNQSQSVLNYIFDLKLNHFYIFLVYFHVMYFVWFKIVSIFFYEHKKCKIDILKVKSWRVPLLFQQRIFFLSTFFLLSTYMTLTKDILNFQRNVEQRKCAWY